MVSTWWQPTYYLNFENSD